MKFVAAQKKLSTGPVTITAKVSIRKVEKGFGLAVELVGHMPDLPRDQALALLEEAHQVCPYSNATRGNIEVKLSLG